MKSDGVYIHHIIDAVDQIMEYTQGVNKNDFQKSRMIQDAVIRNFEIIGEATKQVSDSTRSNFPDVPWKNMAGMRDKLIHDYMGVDLDAIWNTIEEMLPNLRGDLQKIADELDTK